MWKPFSALPNYVGGKRRLIPVIFREIAAVCPAHTWPALTFLDAFMGAGSISLYAKAQGFKVVGNDLAWRCYVVGKGLIENNSRQLTDLDLGLLFASQNGHNRFAEQNCVPHCFQPDVARFIDQALANIRQANLDETHEALLYSAIIRFALMTRIAGQMTNRAWCTRMTLGQYDDISQGQLKSGYVRTFFESLPVRMKTIQKYINGAIFAGRVEMHQEDALDWMPSQQADLVYLDPPYFGSSSYEANYYLLDCVLAGKWLPHSPHSPFNTRATAWLTLTRMFEAVEHIPVWIFSFAENPGGFSINQLCGLIEEFERHAKSIPIIHRWSLATETDHYEAGAKEVLIVATAR